MLRLNLLVLLLIKSIECEVKTEGLSPVLKQFREDILKDYDPNARPVSYNSNVTNLRIELNYLGPFEVDECAQTIDIDSYMDVRWEDDHLTWNPRKYEGIFYLRMLPGEIWMPNIYEAIRGGPSSDIQKADLSFATVYFSGRIIWVIATVLPGTCKFYYKNYPNDSAVCRIALFAWSYIKDTVNVSEVYYHSLRYEFLPVQINSQWELTSVTPERKELKLMTAALFTLTLVRKTPILQQQLLWISSVVIVILSLSMFWIPADIEQKITTGCVMMVILTAVLLTVASSVRARQPVILIAGTIHNLMYASTAAILLEIISINLQHIQEWKPPEFLLNIFSGTVGRILLISSAEQDTLSLDKTKLAENERGSAMLEQLTITGNWKTISQALDRMAFLLYIVLLSAMPKTP